MYWNYLWSTQVESKKRNLWGNMQEYKCTSAISASDIPYRNSIFWINFMIRYVDAKYQMLCIL